ncbi:MAG: hypothetical protein IJ662_08800 [Clostridia bacterium]|nr:hypothetical protein [Clostridia bacterium]MBR1585623.1 hypothetical protein [Clostridia bacterium]
MRKKMSTLLFTLLAMLLAVSMSGCSGSDDAPPQAAEDEILLIIQLDLKEDIGLLILDQNLDGVESSGGISNADKSMLKHDDVLYWTLNKQEYENPADAVNLSFRCGVITEYCDPNYENDYPEEYTVLLDPISFNVDFGETYHITITGDKENGYQAALDET